MPDASSEFRYKRVLLKVSGEVLMGDQGSGIDMNTVAEVAKAVADVAREGVEICLVIGGGNIFRGLSKAAGDMDRASADYMGMLATVMNALAMQAIPLTEVVRLVKPPRTGRDPLYQVMLVYQDSPRGELRLGAATTEPVRVPSVQSTSEVVAELWPAVGGGMDIDITYQADRVAETFAADVVQALVRVIRRAATASPHNGRRRRGHQ